MPGQEKTVSAPSSPGPSLAAPLTFLSTVFLSAPTIRLIVMDILITLRMVFSLSHQRLFDPANPYLRVAVFPIYFFVQGKKVIHHFKLMAAAFRTMRFSSMLFWTSKALGTFGEAGSTLRSVTVGALLFAGLPVATVLLDTTIPSVITGLLGIGLLAQGWSTKRSIEALAKLKKEDRLATLLRAYKHLTHPDKLVREEFKASHFLSDEKREEVEQQAKAAYESLKRGLELIRDKHPNKKNLLELVEMIEKRGLARCNAELIQEIFQLSEKILPKEDYDVLHTLWREIQTELEKGRVPEKLREDLNWMILLQLLDTLSLAIFIAGAVCFLVPGEHMVDAGFAVSIGGNAVEIATALASLGALYMQMKRKKIALAAKEKPAP